jgi:transposase
MELWTKIRMQVARGGLSIREIQRQTGLHFKTIKKILANPEPPPFDCPERSKPKIGPFLERISDIIAEDMSIKKKQRHTAKRIFERIQEEGYTGGYTAVKDVVRELRRTSQEVFVPLVHRPGEAQMDFGEALVKMDGVLRKVKFFAMALPYSDAMFIAAYPRENTETFQDGHVRAFYFFGGVPSRISYDNAKTSVSKIIGAHARKLTHGFLQLQSHYLFQEHFCQVRRPNEKGVVEGVVKFARLNYFVPVPQVKDFDELNTFLAERCRADLERRLRGRKVPKEELLKEDQNAFLELPITPFDACRKVSTTADRLSLVRFDCNDYSVPVRLAHHTVVVKGYTEFVRIFRDDRMIAEHDRIWEKEDIAFDPIHYLELLERKPGPSITPNRCTIGCCQNRFLCCEIASKKRGATGERVSSSPCFDCWSDIPLPRSVRPSTRPCRYVAATATWSHTTSTLTRCTRHSLFVSTVASFCKTSL